MVNVSGLWLGEIGIAEGGPEGALLQVWAEVIVDDLPQLFLELLRDRLKARVIEEIEAEREDEIGTRQRGCRSSARTLEFPVTQIGR